jgi:hypothetical protein
MKPDLVKNIFELKPSELPWKPDIVWASPPCQRFSVLRLGKNWHKGQPKNEETKEAIALLHKTIYLIQELNPRYFFIENPRAMMRTLPIMQSRSMRRRTVTYCQYGEKRQKPTDIWTNCMEWHPIRPCKAGYPCHDRAPRGSATSGTCGQKNARERGKIPDALALEIVQACEEGLQEG